MPNEASEEKSQGLAQSYLNINDEGRDLLDKVTQKLADNPENIKDFQQSHPHAGKTGANEG